MAENKSNKKTIKSQSEEIRNELDSLIGNHDPIENNTDTDPELPAKRENVSRPTYGQLKTNSTKKAKKTITSLMQFYLDQDIIEQDEYIQAKKSIDEMTLSSLIYQLQAGERALTTLLQSIEDGNIEPRAFEVLATLQKSMLDIIKSQTMYLMSAEESTKRIAKDIDIYSKKENKEVGQGNNTNNDNKQEKTQRGTKDLMRMIRQGIDNTDNIEDADVEDEK